MMKRRDEPPRKEPSRTEPVSIVIIAIVAVGLFTTGVIMLTVAWSSYLELGSDTVAGAYKEIVLWGVAGVAFCGFPLVFGGLSLRQHRIQSGIEQPYETVAATESPRYRTRRDENIPDALRGQQPTHDAVVVADAYPSYVLRLFSAAIGMGMVYFGWNVESIGSPDEAGGGAFNYLVIGMGYLFIGLGALVLIAIVRPTYWRSRFLVFIATREGVYFQRIDSPNWQPVTTDSTRWLFVPWSNVVDVREIRAYTHGRERETDAIEFTLCVTAEQARDWFPALDIETGDGGSDAIAHLPILPEWTKPGMLAQLQRLKLDAGN